MEASLCDGGMTPRPKMLLLIHRLLPPPDNVDEDVPKWRAVDWLQRYLDVTRSDTCISPGQLTRHLHTLHTVHHRVLQRTDPIAIPVRTGLGRASSSTSSSFGSSGSSEDDNQWRSEHQHVRTLVATIRQTRCRPVDLGSPSEEAVYAFSTREIRAILLACTTTLERLVVLLLLTTGLRIGGLSRLRLPIALPPHEGFVRGRDIPRTLSTVEKNNATRVVLLTSAVRVLVARWVREGGAQQPPYTFLFPSVRRGRDHPSSDADGPRRARPRCPHIACGRSVAVYFAGHASRACTFTRTRFDTRWCISYT